MIKNIIVVALLSFFLVACALDDGLTPLPSSPGVIEVEANQGAVTIVQNGQRLLLPLDERTWLNIGDQIIVNEQGQATLRRDDLLTAQVLQAGDVFVENFVEEGQLTNITLRQMSGILTANFNTERSADHRLMIETDTASISSIGAEFVVALEISSIDWVLNRGQASDVLEVTASGDKQTVPSETARWLAPGQSPSATVLIQADTIDEWVDDVVAGEPTSSLSDLLLPSADIVGQIENVTVLPNAGQPFDLGSSEQGVVRMTLEPRGLFGSPTYTLEDCNRDGVQELAVLAGIIHFDFNAVYAQTKAFDVSIINRNLPGNGALWTLGPAQNEIARQLFETGDGEAQTLSVRSPQSYKTAKLAMVDACLSGFSLTPPSSDGTPPPPRAVIAQGADSGVVVDVLADDEVEEVEETGLVVDTVPLTDTVESEIVQNSPARDINEGQLAAISVIGSAVPVEIDGALDDWNGLNRPDAPGWIEIDSVIFDDSCNARFPNAAGSEDLSGQVRFAYDEEFLYVAFDVIDDGFVPYSGDDQNYFLGDSPQLSLDMNLLGDFADARRSADDWQVDFYPDPDEPIIVLWQLGSLSVRPFEEASVAVQFDEANYVLEAALPWRSFGITAEIGDQFGLAANINDNDTPDTDAQECIISTAANRLWNDPTTWGSLFLEPDGE